MENFCLQGLQSVETSIKFTLSIVFYKANNNYDFRGDRI